MQQAMPKQNNNTPTPTKIFNSGLCTYLHFQVFWAPKGSFKEMQLKLAVLAQFFCLYFPTPTLQYNKTKYINSTEEKKKKTLWQGERTGKIHFCKGHVIIKIQHNHFCQKYNYPALTSPKATNTLPIFNSRTL